jgi:hydroxymethylglutaryl-CoA reductase (NADPH)
MVGRATFAACSWILEQVDTVRRFYLESNFATDKKASQVNIMRTRQAPSPRSRSHAACSRRSCASSPRASSTTRVRTWLVLRRREQRTALANGITAMFMRRARTSPTSPSRRPVVYVDLLPDQSLYLSITIPSLIVATYGGGTSLATQRECLDSSTATAAAGHKLAEIGRRRARGEISLESAISSLDWVSSHEQYGRNR